MGVVLLDLSPPPESSPTVGGGTIFLAQLGWKYCLRRREVLMNEREVVPLQT